MKVWIFQTGEPLHTDGGSPRPMRAMNLANALVGAGHDVILWSSAFFHQEKRHRTRAYNRTRIKICLEIRLIPSSGYQRNIGIGRLFDHAILAKNLKKILKEEHDVPDVAFVGYPPIEFALVANEWLAEHGVPTLLDVKDQWPQIFVDPFPKMLQPLIRLGLFPYFYLGRQAMRKATAFSSMSQSFLDWMAEFSGRRLGPLDCVVPLSPAQEYFPNQVIAETIHWWGERGVCNDGKIRLFFVGSLSRAFDFGPVIEAARRAANEGRNWQFVICGDGEQANLLSEAFSGFGNVVMPGWVDRPQIVALANISTLGLAPYENTNDFNMSIPNKVIDYLSLGKPIVSPLRGEVENLIERHKVGFIYSSKDGSQLFDVLSKICDIRYDISSTSKNALELYEKSFSGVMVYKNLVDKLYGMSKLKSNLS